MPDADRRIQEAQGRLAGEMQRAEMEAYEACPAPTAKSQTERENSDRKQGGGTLAKKE